MRGGVFIIMMAVLLRDVGYSDNNGGNRAGSREEKALSGPLWRRALRDWCQTWSALPTRQHEKARTAAEALWRVLYTPRNRFSKQTRPVGRHKCLLGWTRLRSRLGSRTHFVFQSAGHLGVLLLVVPLNTTLTCPPHSLPSNSVVPRSNAQVRAAIRSPPNYRAI